MPVSQMLWRIPSPEVLLQVVICTQVLGFALVWSLGWSRMFPRLLTIALAHHSFTRFISSPHRAMAAWKADQHDINVLTHKALKKKKIH